MTVWSDLTTVSSGGKTLRMSPSEPHNRIDRRRLHTRSALLAAARTTFGLKGVEATTIQDITDAADVAKGSFYNHFEDADAILRAVIEETLANLGTELETLTEPLRDDPARVISVSLRHTLRVCTQETTVGWFILRAGDLIEAGEVALGAHGRRDLELGFKTGRFRWENVELIGAMIAGGAQAVVRRRLEGRLPASAERMFVAYVLHLLGVPEDEATAIAAEELPTVGIERQSAVASSPALRGG